MNIIYIKICLEILYLNIVSEFELLYYLGQEMVVQVIDREWVFDMVVVVVEVDSIDVGIEDTEDVEGNMDHPIEAASVDMDEKDECRIKEDKTMNIEGNMDLGKDNTMEWGQAKVRCQVDNKVELVHYKFY